jgi:mRNA-degrading endonuclease YafQ of YafQ-DinJ toxin-antitoxin module
MRTIERSSAFKRDYKRVKTAPRQSKDADSLVSTSVALLLADEPNTRKLP